MKDCIFCKIINNEIPSFKLYENEYILAFLDISQVTKGHVLIIPKEHYKDIHELDETAAKNIFKNVPELATAVKEAFNASGINIVNNNGEAAGQTVFHYHVHIIPRYNEKDGFRTIFTNNMDRYTNDDLKQIANQIKDKL
ncbi:HIT family protein [Haloplasma contractile]|uniref:Ral function prediction only protein n=1 Tax=Haloplasma contractile SSD-17B TaxID=1033810 RepID=U2FI47_9MOLU|nr:HIT family protein [Haloplasma contractile]ERJ12485.1 ral function prediction only protein [Haloplasma contractile SSD-17B]